jgi:hypothetical protein
MGFESPYDVDKAGKRAEFQRRLVGEKRAWEDAHERFVVDRTTMDCLAYTAIHDINAIDPKLLRAAVDGMRRYTHVFVCPVEAFCSPGDDAARVKDMTYHELYDVLVRALLDRYRPQSVKIRTLHDSDLEDRKTVVAALLV